MHEAVERLRAAGHPLGALPLRLLPVEGRPHLPSYHLRGQSNVAPFGPVRRDGEPQPVPPATVAVRDVTGAMAADLITSAVDNWVTDSNGRVAAHVFEVTPPLTPAALDAGLLAGLPVEALAGAGTADITAHRSTAAGAFTVLFAAASAGSAYGHGLCGAYGRLHAWRSMAGLLGVAGPGDAPGGDAGAVERLAGLAEAAGYVTFGARSPWYCQVAWDIGIAVLRPGGGTLAVLAATDED